jgi:hypothetical protein
MAAHNPQLLIARLSLGQFVSMTPDIIADQRRSSLAVSQKSPDLIKDILLGTKKYSVQPDIQTSAGNFHGNQGCRIIGQGQGDGPAGGYLQLPADDFLFVSIRQG